MEMLIINIYLYDRRLRDEIGIGKTKGEEK